MKKIITFIMIISLITGCSYFNKKEVEPTNNKIVSKTKDKKNSNTSEENQKQEELPKHLIVIDAGHQARGNNEKEPIGPGSTTTKPKVASGTVGKWSGLNEYELTLQISLKLKEALLKENYQVIMVRETNNVNISNSEQK